jgi:hypothetical protein
VDASDCNADARIHVYACMHVCVCTYTCMYECILLCTHLYAYTDTYTASSCLGKMYKTIANDVLHTFKCVACVEANVYVCVCARVYICMYIYIYIYMHTYIYTHIMYRHTDNQTDRQTSRHTKSGSVPTCARKQMRTCIDIMYAHVIELPTSPHHSCIHMLVYAVIHVYT